MEEQVSERCRAVRAKNLPHPAVSAGTRDTGLVNRLRAREP